MNFLPSTWSPDGAKRIFIITGKPTVYKCPHCGWHSLTGELTGFQNLPFTRKQYTKECWMTRQVGMCIAPSMITKHRVPARQGPVAYTPRVWSSSSSKPWLRSRCSSGCGMEKPTSRWKLIKSQILKALTVQSLSMDTSTHWPPLRLCQAHEMSSDPKQWHV